MGVPFGHHLGRLLASRWLQHGFQSSQDGSKTTQGASKTLLTRLQDRPRTSQDASGTAPWALQELLSRGGPRASKTPPRALQKRFCRLQAASKSSPEEPSKPPAVALQPLASGLQVASAGCVKRKQFSCGILKEYLKDSKWILKRFSSIPNWNVKGAP